MDSNPNNGVRRVDSGAIGDGNGRRLLQLRRLPLDVLVLHVSVNVGSVCVLDFLDRRDEQKRE